MTSLDLSPGSWNPLSGSTANGNDGPRTVIDESVSGTKKFYTVEIVKP